MSTLAISGASISAQRLSTGVILLAWLGDARRDRTSRVELDGIAVPPPILSVTAPLETGGARHFMAIRTGETDRASVPVLIDQQGAPALAANLDLSPSGLADLDPNSLLDGLEKIGRVRLARFLLEVCASTFQLSRDPFYVQCIQHLVEALNPRPGSLIACASIEADAVLCQTAVSPGIGPLQSAVVVNRGRIDPIVFAPEIDGNHATEGKLAPAWMIAAGRQIKANSTVVIFGEHGLAVRRHTGPRPSVPTVLDWLRHPGAKSDGAIHYVVQWLMRKPKGTGSALAREIAALHGHGLATQAAPQIDVALHCCVATRGGVFIAGRLADRYRLARAIRVRGGGFHGEIAVDALAGIGNASPGVDGWPFVGLVRGSHSSEPGLMHISVVLHSGAVIAGPTVSALETGTDARRAILQITARSAPSRAAVEHIGPALDGLCTAPQLDAGLGAQLMQFGKESDAPKVSLIIPFSRARASLTAQAAALCTQRDHPAFEIIRILDRPEAHAGAERALDHLWKCFGLGGRLMSVPRRWGADAAIASAARVARAQCIVFLGRDVIPEQPASLSLLTGGVLGRSDSVVCGGRVLNPDMSMDGPRLLLADGEDNRFSLKVPLMESAGGENCRLVALSCKAMAMPRMLIEQIGAPHAAYLTDHWRDADVSARALQAEAFLIHDNAATFTDFSAAFDSPEFCAEWGDMIDERRFTAEWSARLGSTNERPPDLQLETDGNATLRAA